MALMTGAYNAGTDLISETSGLFKKVRAVRPQPVLRAERTGNT